MSIKTPTPADYRAWSAICPQCNIRVNPGTIARCNNCGKGQRLALVGEGEKFSFACQRCKSSVNDPACPKCGTNLAGVAQPGINWKKLYWYAGLIPLIFYIVIPLLKWIFGT